MRNQNTAVAVVSIFLFIFATKLMINFIICKKLKLKIAQ